MLAIDFSPRTWTDETKTVPRKLHSYCRACTRITSQASYAWKARAINGTYTPRVRLTEAERMEIRRRQARARHLKRKATAEYREAQKEQKALARRRAGIPVREFKRIKPPKRVNPQPILDWLTDYDYRRLPDDQKRNVRRWRNGKSANIGAVDDIAFALGRPDIVSTLYPATLVDAGAS